MHLRVVKTETEEEWLSARKGLMTSSVVAAALGLHPHMTPMQAWAAITGRDTFEGNKATLRGTVLEPPVLDYPCIANKNLKRIPAPFIRSEWSGDSADCIYIDDASSMVGEGKTVAQGSADKWGEEHTDHVPAEVIIQTSWHLMHHPEAVSGIVSALIGGYQFEFRQYVVRSDYELLGWLEEQASKFYRDYVINDVAPPAEIGDDAILSKLWPVHKAKKWLAATDQIEKLALDYVAAREAAKAAEEQKKLLYARIIQQLEDHEGCERKGAFRILYRKTKDGLRTDWEAIAKQLGASDELIEQHTRTTVGHRALRVTLPKQKDEK